MRGLLLAWALGATVLAALWAPRDQAPRARAPGNPGLLRRIAELEQALASRVPPPPVAPGPPARGVEDLLDASRAAARDPDAAIEARQAADGALHALLARDAASHAALARMLPEADEETCDLLVAALVLNPFVKAARSAAVTAEVLGNAARCLRADEPHVRAAAARLLLGYATPPEPPHVRLATGALLAERDPLVRDAILESVAEHARGVALTEEDAAPLVAQLRARAEAGETGWLCALADWSGSEGDYDRAEALLRIQTETGARQECLNAFRREARLVEGRVERAEALLRDAMLDASLDDDTRALARFLLDGYAPWGAETADAVRGYEGISR